MGQAGRGLSTEVKKAGICCLLGVPCVGRDGEEGDGACRHSWGGGAEPSPSPGAVVYGTGCKKHWCAWGCTGGGCRLGLGVMGMPEPGEPREGPWL